ncbi:acyl-CoA synthetase MbcS [Rummeliibacillus stabekisii]|uniref:acyl-CoA synthetase MbcS n=1 Tax=Rummeliibacillus stabekisii TaxID=241244 RepID=UPI001170CE26|nr:acyl--CoA ligase [Rummeliibacillus stabekisii]MBB5168718.1 acetyl-CoA synthetase [Rummeliibacillus stabekisii]GEL05143.1 acyl--CoA ligase [Rummeliibacillus stabekisii]
MKREELIAPEVYNLVREIEKYAAEPTKTALRFENEHGSTDTITYKALIQKANQMANVFASHGLQKGDVVLIMVPRLIDAYITYIAALKAGLVVIPSSEMLRAKEIDYRLAHSGAKAVIAYEPFIEQFEQVENLQDVQQYVIGQAPAPWIELIQETEQASDVYEMADTKSSDMAFLSYTSGTTGNPKGVVHTHGWAYAHLKTAAAHWLGIQEGDLVWATASPGWQKWIWSPFLSVLGSGATGFVYNGRFQPEKYLSLLEKYKVQVLCCTPTEYRLMAKVDNLDVYDLTTLRSAVSAGEPLNQEVINLFKKHFDLDVRDGYGQTENTLLIGNLKGEPFKPGSMGKPTPGNLVEVIDDEGIPCPAGIVGDIAVHRSTPALFKEYLNDPERTTRQFRGDYYVTGDRARKDEDGYFFFEGRNDDIIISSGYTIGPFEVEDALVKHPLVQECAVVASPDEVRGSIVKAFVVLKDHSMASGELVKELQNHTKELTAPYKYPREIQFVEELPKTTSGKIRRIELREHENRKLHS